MKMEETECSETSEYKIQRPEITQRKAYNIQNKANVWNQEYKLKFTYNNPGNSQKKLKLHLALIK
jgi:hypothetical protein